MLAVGVHTQRPLLMRAYQAAHRKDARATKHDSARLSKVACRRVQEAGREPPERIFYLWRRHRGL